MNINFNFREDNHVKANIVYIIVIDFGMIIFKKKVWNWLWSNFGRST